MLMENWANETWSGWSVFSVDERFEKNSFSYLHTFVFCTFIHIRRFLQYPLTHNQTDFCNGCNSSEVFFQYNMLALAKQFSYMRLCRWLIFFAKSFSFCCIHDFKNVKDYLPDMEMQKQVLLCLCCSFYGCN
jgi:hypothetical protein